MHSTPLRRQFPPATPESYSASLCPLFALAQIRHKCTPAGQIRRARATSKRLQAEKSRFHHQRTTFLNTRRCGHLSGKPQHFAFCTLIPLRRSRPETFWLTSNELGVLWKKVA